MNKRKQRTEELRKVIEDVVREDYVVNAIEQHNFDKLVHSGVIVRRPGVPLQAPESSVSG